MNKISTISKLATLAFTMFLTTNLCGMEMDGAGKRKRDERHSIAFLVNPADEAGKQRCENGQEGRKIRRIQPEDWTAAQALLELGRVDFDTQTKTTNKSRPKSSPPVPSSNRHSIDFLLNPTPASTPQ